MLLPNGQNDTALVDPLHKDVLGTNKPHDCLAAERGSTLDRTLSEITCLDTCLPPPDPPLLAKGPVQVLNPLCI